MGKFQVKVCIILCWALMLMFSDARREYFPQNRNLTWVDARNYCQACFKELVTLTPDNIQALAQEITSDHWIGLRKNFNFENNSIDNSTFNLASTAYVNGSNTSIPIMNWTQWANGDPLAFQNWYPGWPLPKPSPKPPNKTVCCSCSCTCPLRATTPRTTPFATNSQFTTPNTKTTQSGSTSFHDLTGNTADITSFTDQSVFTDKSTTPVTVTEKWSTQSSPQTTAEMPLEAECVRSPMLEPEEPVDEDDSNDKNYIEDSCVAMLSFGPWIEKSCLDLLPFICYEDRFMGQVNVTNITFDSAKLSWMTAPGDISHYRVEVKGQKDNKTWVENITVLTYDLNSMTPGTSYSVQVFAVKCDRDLNPQNATFYTIPKPVLNLKVSSVESVSVSLSWDKPEGNVNFYRVSYETTILNVPSETNARIVGLIPGTLYNFTVVSGVTDGSKWSYEAHVSAYTKPSKVNNLTVYNSTSDSMSVKWDPPVGNFTGILVVAKNASGVVLSNNTVDNTKLNVTVKGLPPATQIFIYVTVQGNENLEGETQKTNSFTPPGPISNLTLATTNNALSATWSPPMGSALNFTVELWLNQTRQNSTTVNDTNIAFYGLRNAANYTVVVYAQSGQFKSDSVNASKFTLPNPPENVIASSSNKTSITFTWDKPKDTETPTYGVSLISSFWGQSWNYQTSFTTFTFIGLTSGTNYTFNVYTIADGKQSASVPCNKSTDPDLREISLSMLCSSSVPLLCDSSSTRVDVFNKLKRNFAALLDGHINWDFKQ